jgi:signal transduction histidine kinase
MTPQGHPGPGSRILLVDDEEGIRNVLGVSLADMGYEVRTAAGGEEALALFRDFRPPIVLTDIKMPGMDGIGLLERIKQLEPETEVIMITGHGDIDLAIRSLKLEATDFITKPIHDEALEIALKRAWERIALRRQLKAYTQNLEQLVEEKTRKLLEAERLTAVGQTIAGLSHAIKNIAGGLKGGAYVLEKGIELNHPEYLARGWTMVKGNVDKITNLSLDLLDYAKPGAARYRLADANQPAREVVELMRARAAERGVELGLEAAPGMPPQYLDPEGLHRCLLNLVTNAIDACEGEEGAADPGRPRQVVVTVIAEAGWGVTYRVSDNCCGMPPEVREKIFQRFFSTKGNRGTGIGLMLTKKIVDDLKGSIEVETEAGVGSTFTIRIPAGRKTWRRRF